MATKQAKKAPAPVAPVRPVHEIRLGRIRAAIWENPAPEGRWFNVTVSRLYKDGNFWKDSYSFGRDDLLMVGKVLDLCHTWICMENGNTSAIEDTSEIPD